MSTGRGIFCSSKINVDGMKSLDTVITPRKGSLTSVGRLPLLICLLTLLHTERPKHHTILAFLSAIWLNEVSASLE